MAYKKITLNYWEAFTACNVAINRRLQARFKKSPDSVFGVKKSDGWENDIEGACAEMAFCKIHGLYWDASVNTYKLPDIPDTNIQIRSTTYDSGKLIIRENDPDNDIYILVIGQMPNYKIIGGIQGKAGKHERFLSNPNNQAPCYMIAKHYLDDEVIDVILYGAKNVKND